MTGLGIDKAILAERLALLDEAIEVLTRRQGATQDDLKASVELRWVVQHGLLTSVQSVLDVAGHIVAASGAPTPEDYRSSILALGRLGVIPDELADKLAPMAGFRNILVHEYAHVDLGIVIHVLNEDLSDLARFVDHLSQYIENESPEQT